MQSVVCRLPASIQGTVRDGNNLEIGLLFFSLSRFGGFVDHVFFGELVMCIGYG